MREGVRAREDQTSGRQLLAAVGAATRDHLAAAGSGHARTEAVTALTDELARLVGSLHGSEPSKVEARSRAADAAPDLHASWLSANTKGAHAGRHVASGGLMAEGSHEVNVSPASMTLELHEGAHLDAHLAQALCP